MLHKVKTDITNLTTGFCNQLKAKDERYFVRDSLVPGLWLKIMPTSGYKSWVYSCRPKGQKTIRVVIGSYDELSPAKARLRVKKIQRDTNTKIVYEKRNVDSYFTIEGDYENVHKARIILQDLEKEFYRKGY